ncbi:MAG: xanthine dehydrogenase small subunit [Pseudomonadota bacterium]
MTETLRFLLNDRAVALDGVAPSDTLLDYLRLDARLRGTKEGCAEGDCGACTVLVGRLAPQGLVYETVNACIRLMPSLHACHVVTIEHLGRAGALHPVQQAMVDCHGAQCGFCTPGIVMSLYGLWLDDPAPDADAIETSLQGNLCRCTGYAPILRAAEAAAQQGGQAADPLVKGRAAVAARLAEMRGDGRVELARGGERAILPADLDDLTAVMAEEPDATVIAGATDVGLWVTKERRAISPAVFIGHLEALRSVEIGEVDITIGAGVTYAEMEAVVAAEFPFLAAYWHRIGGRQVRNMGTVGGNVANGSPIGDTPPPLIALGAEVVLMSAEGRRVLALEDFFIAYGRQDRRPGEVVAALRIPKPAPDAICAAYKVSKRRDEDISAVCGAFQLTLSNGIVSAARIAFGGMAATPRRARAVEAALIGRPWSEASAMAAGAAFAEDFAPISDWRASAEYRAAVARNLLTRLYLEHSDAAAARLPERGAA